MNVEQLQRAILERRRALGEASRELAHGMSVESDRWFLSGLGALDRSVRWTESGVGALFKRVGSLRGRKPAKQRFVELLRREARRAKLDVPEQDFQIFADKMATLIELVMSGAVSIHDIAFEAERAGAADDAAQAACNGSGR